MKGYMKWANEWRNKYSSPGDFEETGQQEAWVAGFLCAREHAAGMVDGFRNPANASLVFLIRAIGEATLEDSPSTTVPEKEK